MSRQLDAYLARRALGETMSTAAMNAGLGIGEARLTENEIARGDITLPTPDQARATLQQQENETMAEGTVAADELRLFIERVERLEEEKKAIADDIRDVYAEAKARGYDTRTMREVVKLRKLETQERREREALLDTYKAALGLDYAETPLGRAALAAVA